MPDAKGIDYNNSGIKAVCIGEAMKIQGFFFR